MRGYKSQNIYNAPYIQKLLNNYKSYFTGSISYFMLSL